MKKVIFGTIAATLMSSLPALAWEGQVVKCYDKIWVPAEYKTTKTLHMKSRTEWEHCGDQLCEVYYPPMYMENRTLVREGHYVKRQAACRNR